MRTCPVCKSYFSEAATSCPHDGAALIDQAPLEPTASLEVQLDSGASWTPEPVAAAPASSQNTRSLRPPGSSTGGSRGGGSHGGHGTGSGSHGGTGSGSHGSTGSGSYGGSGSGGAARLSRTSAEPLYASQAAWSVHPKSSKRSRRPGKVESEARLGRVLGSYRLIEVLGLGGMGTVYRAEHIKLGREVALKLLHEDYAQRRDAVSRFFQEARAVNKIRHRNIVDVTDLVELSDGTTFLVMELLTGVPLTRLMRGAAKLEIPRALALLLQICDGLSAAHSVGIVHRDLKPDNIFVVVTPDGADVVKLVDFGVAKLISGDQREAGTRTVVGAVIGTPAFMSPEQAGGMRVDARSDIYSLGAIMYEMFTGSTLFRGKSFTDYVRKHLSETPLPPSRTPGGGGIDPHLEEIVLKCLEKRPTDRYQTARELRADLLEALAQLGGNEPRTAEDPAITVIGDDEPATQPVAALTPQEREISQLSASASGPAVTPSGARLPAPGDSGPTPASSPPYLSTQLAPGTPAPSGSHSRLPLPSAPTSFGATPVPPAPPIGYDTALTAGDLPRDATQQRSPWRLPLFFAGGLVAASVVGVALLLVTDNRGEQIAGPSKRPQPAEKVAPEHIEKSRAVPSPIVKPMGEAAEKAARGRLVTVRFFSTPKADIFPSGLTEATCTTPCDVTINPADGGSPRRRDFLLRRDGYQAKRVTVNLREPRDVIEVSLERSEHPHTSSSRPESRHGRSHAGRATEGTNGSEKSNAGTPATGDSARDPKKKEHGRAYDPEETLDPFGSDG